MRTCAIFVTAAALFAPACSGSGNPPPKTTAARVAPSAAPATAAVRTVPARLHFAPESEPIEETDPVALEGDDLLDLDLPEIPPPADGEVVLLGVPPEERPLLFVDGFNPVQDVNHGADVPNGPDIAEPEAEPMAEELVFEDGFTDAADEAPFDEVPVEEIVYDEGVQAGTQTILVETPVLVIRGYRNYAYGRFPAVCATAGWDPCPTPSCGAWWDTGAWDPCWDPCCDPRYRSWDEYWRRRDESPADCVAGAVARPVVADRKARAAGPVFAARDDSPEPAVLGPRVRDGDHVRSPRRPESPKSPTPLVPVASTPAPVAAAAPLPRASNPDSGFRVLGPRVRAEKARERARASLGEDGLLGTHYAGEFAPQVASRQEGSRREGGTHRADDASRRDDRSDDRDAGASRGRRQQTAASRDDDGDADNSRGRGNRAAREDDSVRAATRATARASEPVRGSRVGNRDADSSNDRPAVRVSRGNDASPSTPAASAPRATPGPVASSGPAPSHGHSRGGNEGGDAPPPSPSRGGGRK